MKLAQIEIKKIPAAQAKQRTGKEFDRLLHQCLDDHPKRGFIPRSQIGNLALLAQLERSHA